MKRRQLQGIFIRLGATIAEEELEIIFPGNPTQLFRQLGLQGNLDGVGVEGNLV